MFLWISLLLTKGGDAGQGEVGTSCLSACTLPGSWEGVDMDHDCLLAHRKRLTLFWFSSRATWLPLARRKGLEKGFKVVGCKQYSVIKREP